MKRTIRRIGGIVGGLCCVCLLSGCSVTTFARTLFAEESSVASEAESAVSAVSADTVTLTVGSVSGQKGDLVLVPVSVSAESHLVNGDLYLHYDTTRLRAVKQYDADADKSYWATTGIWIGSLWAEEPMAGTVHVALASSDEGLTKAGALFHLTFEVLDDLTTPAEVSLEVPVCGVNINGTDTDLAQSGTVTPVAGRITALATDESD